MESDPGTPDPPGAPDARLVRLPAAGSPPPTHTAMCCVSVYREASGRTWYRITTAADVLAGEPEERRDRGAPAEVVADVRAFLLRAGQGPTRR